MEISKLDIQELYHYEKVCETIINKYVNAINLEKSDKPIGTEHIETENERMFKKYTNIYNALIDESKTRLTELTWKH